MNLFIHCFLIFFFFIFFARDIAGTKVLHNDGNDGWTVVVCGLTSKLDGWQGVDRRGRGEKNLRNKLKLDRRPYVLTQFEPGLPATSRPPQGNKTTARVRPRSDNGTTMGDNGKKNTGEMGRKNLAGWPEPPSQSTGRTRSSHYRVPPANKVDSGRKGECRPK